MERPLTLAAIARKISFVGWQSSHGTRADTISTIDTVKVRALRARPLKARITAWITVRTKYLRVRTKTRCLSGNSSSCSGSCSSYGSFSNSTSSNQWAVSGVYKVSAQAGLTPLVTGDSLNWLSIHGVTVSTVVKIALVTALSKW